MTETHGISYTEDNNKLKLLRVIEFVYIYKEEQFYEKLLSVMSVALFLLTLLAPRNVLADSNSDRRVTIADISEEFLQELATAGVEYTEKTCFVETQIAVPGKRELHTGVSVITPGEGNTLHVSTITYMDADNAMVDYSLEDVQSTLRVSFPWNQTFTAYSITSTATYDRVAVDFMTYYRPNNISVLYAKRSAFAAGASFSVRVDYYTVGVLKSYPALNELNSAYSHQITVNPSNPAANTIYRTTRALSSSAVIDICSGLYNGHWSYVQATYNGSTVSYYANVE